MPRGFNPFHRRVDEGMSSPQQSGIDWDTLSPEVQSELMEAGIVKEDTLPEVKKHEAILRHGLSFRGTEITELEERRAIKVLSRELGNIVITNYGS